MCGKGHKYRRLNDTKLFCARCGLVLTVAGSWTWYQPYPYLPYPNPYWTWTSNVTGSVTVDTNVTAPSWSGLTSSFTSLESGETES